jgi:hypothetical protein
VRGEELLPVGGEDVLDLYHGRESIGLATESGSAAACR